MKQRNHIALLIALLLLPGIAGNVTLHACWVAAFESCCETAAQSCCDDDEAPPACEAPGCGSCEAPVAAQSDDCKCSACHVTLPAADMKATIPFAKKFDLDAAPVAVLADMPMQCPAISAAIRMADDPSPPLFPGIPSTVLLI